MTAVTAVTGEKPIYVCMECGERATHFTSLNGQAQTFYCCEHIPTLDGESHG